MRKSARKARTQVRANTEAKRSGVSSSDLAIRLEGDFLRTVDPETVTGTPPEVISVELRHHLFDRITMDPVGVRRPYSAEVKHLAERGGDARHDRLVEAGERTFDEPPIVERAELVDEQVRVAPQRRLRGHADAQGLGVVYQIRGQRND